MKDFNELLNIIKTKSASRKHNTFLIGIDGFGGSGKSTIAKFLKENLENVTIVEMDDFYIPSLKRADYLRVDEQVLQQLVKNEIASYQRYDWKKDTLAEWHEIKPGGIVIIGGVYSTHPAIAASYDFKVWVDCPQEIGFKRGVNRDRIRDKVDNTDRWLHLWMPEEKEYVESEKPQEKADYILDGTREAEEIIIAEATPDDVIGMRAVQKETWFATYPNEKYGITLEDIKARFTHGQEEEDKIIEERKKALESDNQKSWVAKLNGRIVGFCAATKGEENHIQAIYILPEFQGKGLGRELIQKGFNWLGTEKNIYVNTATYNDKAIAFYKNIGFVDTGERAEPSVVFQSGHTIPEMKMVKMVCPKSFSANFVQSKMLEFYGVTPIKPLELKSEGIENVAWVIYTDKQNYILKIFSTSNTIEKDVNTEVNLYEYLLQHKIHVPEVISNLADKKVSIIMNDKVPYPAILMKYENLKRYTASDLSKEQLHKIATTIAHMHKVLMIYLHINEVHPSIHDEMSIYNHSIKDFERFLTSPNAQSPHLQDHDRLRKIRENAIHYLQQQKLAPDVTQSVIHNDLALEHILFLPSGEPYIFDFSDFEYGPVSLDLGVLFFNFYREGQLTIDAWRAMVKDFLTIYTQTVPLSENDKKAIDIFTVSRLLEHIRYLDDLSIKEGSPVDDKGVKKRYDLLEHLYIAEAK